MAPPVSGIVIQGGIDIGPGISIGAGGGFGSFTLSPSDFTNAGGGYNVVPNGPNNGFTNNGNEGPGNNLYNVYLGTLEGGNPTKATEIYNYFVNNGLSTNSSASYIFDVTWGAGGSPTSTKVVMSLYYLNSNYIYLYIGTVYTGDNVWQTGGQDIFNSTLKSAQGTYNLPATFKLYSPLITDNSNWC